MLEIHQTVRAARYPSCAIPAREIEVTPQTIQQDINFRRDPRVLAERYHVALGVDQARQQRLPTQIVSPIYGGTRAAGAERNG